MMKMLAQLELWSSKIDSLTARTELAGSRPRYEELVQIDELKALLAIARSKVEEYWTAPDAMRARLRAELHGAWNELDAALNGPRLP